MSQYEKEQQEHNSGLNHNQSMLSSTSNASKMSKLKYVKDKLLRKSSILSQDSHHQPTSSKAEGKQRRSNSTYLAATSSSSSSNAMNNIALASMMIPLQPQQALTQTSTSTSNLVSASSEFNLAVDGAQQRDSLASVAASAATAVAGQLNQFIHNPSASSFSASSIHSSASFLHSTNYQQQLNSGAFKKPRIMSVIAQQQTLNEDEEVL